MLLTLWVSIFLLWFALWCVHEYAPVGTKSLLWGVHCFFIHPFWVALAWKRLYGFPWDPRLWVAFVVHDWGYWGKKHMDGPDGDRHVILGAQIMHFLFDRPRITRVDYPHKRSGCSYSTDYNNTWNHFCLLHSRFWAKQIGRQPSKLCMADKLSMVLEPWWLYLPRAWASGELDEYLASARPGGKHGHMQLNTFSARQWFTETQEYMRKYVEEYKNGALDKTIKIWVDEAEGLK